MKSRTPILLRAWPWTASVLAAVVGLLVLLGWAVEGERLKRILPGFVAMNPMTAVCFACAGLSLALSLRKERSRASHLSAKVLATAITLVGLIKGLELVGVQLYVDQFLFFSKLSDLRDLLPNRMAPNTAWNFILVGISLLTLRRRSNRFSVSQVCALLAAFGALLPLTGYIYGVHEFRGLASFSPMAVHTALTFLVLSGGLFFAAKTPLAEIFSSAGPEGVLLRRLLPLVMLVTLFLGWLRLWGERAGHYESAFGTALFAVSLTVILGLLIRSTVRTVAQLESERSAATVRLQEANRRKDEMIAVVSHDLCSPLTGFRIVIDLLREGEGKASEELLDLMDHSARRMVSMVRGLLDVSKLSSDQVELERENLLVSEVIRQSMEPLVINADAKHIAMELTVEEGEPTVFADRLRVAQIFNNLLSNAVKFTAPGGLVSVAINPANQGVCITVSDTGLGIASGELPHVFDKYFQASTKATAGEKGTGLGLAIVREMILLHEGRIDVTSEVNTGTTFTVHLPLKPSSSAGVQLKVLETVSPQAIAA